MKRTLTALTALAILALILAGCALPQPAQEVKHTGAKIIHAIARLHHTGLRLSHHPTGLSATGRQLASAPYPDSVDLSQWDPPVGDQGQVSSCVTWALAEYRYWLLAHDQGIRLDGSFAPMFLYTRSDGGSDNGSDYPTNLNLLETQGITPDAQYGPKPRDTDGPHAGRYDWQDQPAESDVFTASAYRITGYRNVFEGAGTPGAVEAIKAALAQGYPVAIAIPVFSSFMFAGSKYPTLVDQPQSGEQFFGYHAVFAPKYSPAGLTIENSWSTSWGAAGWATLSWSFVSTRVLEAWVMTGPQPQPTATPTATETPLPTPTSAPSPTATATAQATVTVTATTVPPPPTPPAVPTTTAAPRPTATVKPRRCIKWVRTNIKGILWCSRWAPAP